MTTTTGTAARTRCTIDREGFHVLPNGRKSLQRYGIDAHAWRCSQCQGVGDIKRGRFVAREATR